MSLILHIILLPSEGVCVLFENNNNKRLHTFALRIETDNNKMNPMAPQNLIIDA